MIKIKQAIIATVAVAFAAPALSLTTAEALVFDHKVSGVYSDRGSNGLIYLQRKGVHMILMQGNNSPAFVIDSVSVDSVIEHTVNVIDGNDSIHTFNLISSMMAVYGPSGDVNRMTRIRGLSQRDLAHTKPIISQVFGEPQEAIKASFDCAKAGNRVERMICSDPVVAELDVEMGQKYKSLMSMAENKAFHRREQREWIKVRNACQGAQCMADSYVEQLEQIDLSLRHMSKPAEHK